MGDFIILIVVIFGILNLILFFKIWGMTDKVKNIHSMISKEWGWGQGFTQLLYNYRVNGNIQKGLEMLNGAFLRELAPEIEKWQYRTYFEEKDYIEDRNKLVEKYAPYYKALGKEIPKDLSEISFNTAKWIFGVN